MKTVCITQVPLSGTASHSFDKSIHPLEQIIGFCFHNDIVSHGGGFTDVQIYSDKRCTIPTRKGRLQHVLSNGEMWYLSTNLVDGGHSTYLLQHQ